MSELMERAQYAFHGRHADLTEKRDLVTVAYNTCSSIGIGKVTFIFPVLQYLKVQRLPPQTFIPLQSVRVKPIVEKLRTLGGSAQLVFDVIQYPF